MRLSPREIEIIHLMADGKTDNEIAHELGLAYRYVTECVRRIFAKFDVDNRVSAVMGALAHGYLHVARVDDER